MGIINIILTLFVLYVLYLMWDFFYNDGWKRAIPGYGMVSSFVGDNNQNTSGNSWWWPF